MQTWYLHLNDIMPQALRLLPDRTVVSVKSNVDPRMDPLGKPIDVSTGAVVHTVTLVLMVLL